MGRDALIGMIAAKLEEWDMKDPPNAYTGWPYEMIAEDILNMLTRPHPGGRYVLTDEEVEEMWRRIDERKARENQTDRQT